MSTRLQRCVVAIAAFTSIAFGSIARAGTFEAIASAGCLGTFTTGEQYRDPIGWGPGTNGLVYAQDQWSMLTRWQGQREWDFVDHAVAYDIGAFTGLHGATQRGVNPERSDGSAGVQSNCLTNGMLINTWTIPHRPVVGGWYNDMLGYYFSVANQVTPFIKNGVPTHLVLQSSIAVPLFSPTYLSGYTDGMGIPVPPGAQIGFFAYLRDVTAPPGTAPIVVLAMAYMSVFSGTGADGLIFRYRDYTSSETNATNAAYPNWATAAGGNGVCFLSAAITSGKDTFVTKVYSEGETQELAPRADLNQPMSFWRVHITPMNLTNIVNRINNPTVNEVECPFKPPSGYSENSANWVLEYAGVIAEADIPSDPGRGSFDISRTDWVGQWGRTTTNPNGTSTVYNDQSKDQVALGVRLYDTGIFRYFP